MQRKRNGPARRPRAAPQYQRRRRRKDATCKLSCPTSSVSVAALGRRLFCTLCLQLGVGTFSVQINDKIIIPLSIRPLRNAHFVPCETPKSLPRIYAGRGPAAEKKFLNTSAVYTRMAWRTGAGRRAVGRGRPSSFIDHSSAGTTTRPSSASSGSRGGCGNEKKKVFSSSLVTRYVRTNRVMPHCVLVLLPLDPRCFVLAAPPPSSSAGPGTPPHSSLCFGQ